MFNDVELIRGIQNGCSDCFAKLFHKYCKLVRSIIWKVLRQDSEVDDVVQEVFVGIFERAAEFDPTRGSAAAWIAQSAYWKARTRRRQLVLIRAREIEEQSPEMSGCQEPRNDLDQSERIAVIAQGLRLLNEKQRATIELVHFEGNTLAEAATMMGESLSNVRNLYYRGMKALRAHLAPEQRKDTDCFKGSLGITRSTSA